MQMLQRVNAIPDLGGPSVEFYRRRISRFTRYEQVLAFLLMGIPIVLLAFGDETPIGATCGVDAAATCRDSISAFHDIGQPPLFYMPLTVAAFMFLNNAVLRRENWWNAIAGLALAGVVLFDHDAYATVHNIFAVVFFVTTMLTVAWYLPKDLSGTTGARVPLTVPLVARTLSLLGAQGLLFAIVYSAFNLFVAEAVQLWIVAGHYIFHSIKQAQIETRV